jgi:hypothetical protein
MMKWEKERYVAPLWGGDGAASGDVESSLVHTFKDEENLFVSQENSTKPTRIMLWATILIFTASAASFVKNTG